MLKDNLQQKTVVLGVHGFIVGVEVEKGTPIEPLTDRLAGALTFMEGVGKTDVEYLGELEVVDEDQTPTQLEHVDGYSGAD